MIDRLDNYLIVYVEASPMSTSKISTFSNKEFVTVFFQKVEGCFSSPELSHYIMVTGNFKDGTKTVLGRRCVEADA